jgi:soluble cytochrome b562
MSKEQEEARLAAQGADTLTAETAPDMTEEDLLAYLGGTENTSTEEESASSKTSDSPIEFEGKDDKDDKDDLTPSASTSKEGKEGEDSSKTSAVKDEEFTNMVDYLNKEHELGLNVNNLPSDLSREQEAEIVSNLFQRTLDGVNRQLAQYQEVQKVLDDEEVKNFIAAKSEGKSLREYVKEFSQTTEGQSDEIAVRNQLTTQYPNMTKEEIEDMIDVYKDKGTLEKMATAAREAQTKAEQAEQEREAQRAEQEYAQGIQEFGKLVKSAGKVYGIPLTDEVKNDVFAAVTQRDENGETYMDKILNTDQGLFLAALGTLHMETLMKARSSTDSNRSNKKLVDRLFDKASDLQSSSNDDEKQEGFNAELADRF